MFYFLIFNLVDGNISNDWTSNISLVYIDHIA